MAATEDIRKPGGRDPDEAREISLAEIVHPNQVAEVSTSLATVHLTLVSRWGLHDPSLSGIPTLSTEKMEIVLNYSTLQERVVQLWSAQVIERKDWLKTSVVEPLWGVVEIRDSSASVGS